MTFIPTHYARLVQRSSDVVSGLIHYRLTWNGIEDPKCTIVPLMFIKSGDITICLICFADKIYRAYDHKRSEALNQFHVWVPINAEPIQDSADETAENLVSRHE